MSRTRINARSYSVLGNKIEAKGGKTPASFILVVFSERIF